MLATFVGIQAGSDAERQILLNVGSLRARGRNNVT
jgi:hypothetical protein